MKGGDAKLQFVTYESLFALMQTMFALVAAISSVITLVVTIVKLNGSSKGNGRKRKK